MMWLSVIACAVSTSTSQGQEPDRPDVLLISLDTLRADRLGAYGHEGGLTPNLDRFAADAVVFEQAIAPSNETLFSHAALLAGRHVSELGPVTYAFGYPDDVPTLPGVLGLYDVQSAAFVGGGHLNPVFGLGRDFDAWVNVAEWGSLFHSVPPALEWLDARATDDPYLLLVHGYDCHNRYLKPTPWGYSSADPMVGPEGQKIIQRIGGTTRVVDGQYFGTENFDSLFDRDRLRIWDAEGRAAVAARPGEPLNPQQLELIGGSYDGAVRYADAWFGELMAGLEARGELDDTLIIVFGDHGELLGEEGLYNHRPPLDPAVLQVPLLIRPPGGRAGRVAETVSLVDVAPTIYEALAVPPPAELSGRSLWGAVQGDPLAQQPAFAESAYRELAVVQGDVGLVFSGVSPHNPLLRSLLEAAADDGPAFRGWGTEPLSLRPALEAWRSGGTPVLEAGVVSDERLKLLQERGYWSP
ncbi:MAG: sulfatase [Proteobacteria bacterium]|nr:sulfatase [Pseudomonadota bacterium]MCP4921583.1 sulfatase [Pseudomonadota bacterium]